MTTQAVAMILGMVSGKGVPPSCPTLLRSKPTPMASTTRLPTSRTTRRTLGKTSSTAPIPKKQARARETSKKITMAAVASARRRGQVRAALMTNKFCTPMGAT